MSCSICIERFNGEDNLYSTSCGHVYHYDCMKLWQDRNGVCPQCRTYNPATHKIYLEFEDEVPQASSNLAMETNTNPENVQSSACFEMLQETLEDTLNHNSRLEKELEDSKNEILQLRLQNALNTTRISLLNFDVQKLKSEQQQKQGSGNSLQSHLDKVLMATSMYIYLNDNNSQHLNSFTRCSQYLTKLLQRCCLYYERSEICRAELHESSILFVQFRRSLMKASFLANHYLLLRHTDTEDIEFGDCIPKNHEDINTSLFKYALYLKNFHYKHVFVSSGKVYAKKDEDQEACIEIMNKQQVDQMIKAQIDNGFDFI